MRLAHLIDQVRRRLEQPHTLDSLAEDAKMSRRSFTRHFKAREEIVVEDAKFVIFLNANSLSSARQTPNLHGLPQPRLSCLSLDQSGVCIQFSQLAH